tara:strand:+ start:69 stop:281 length:213 start_codon:yes stop_codon:yes gene_type:complete
MGEIVIARRNAIACIAPPSNQKKKRKKVEQTYQTRSTKFGQIEKQSRVIPLLARSSSMYYEKHKDESDEG